MGAPARHSEAQEKEGSAVAGVASEWPWKAGQHFGRGPGREGHKGREVGSVHSLTWLRPWVWMAEQAGIRQVGPEGLHVPI